MNAGPLKWRAPALAALAQPLDVLIVGGGIVGAGIARDAAMRGLRAGLIEQRDFASGTSSHSSRLLHGGLRYLAQGRLGLVREASVEKRILHRIAPHLAQPLRFIFPTYRHSQWPLWRLRIGVKAYDWLCGTGNFAKSSSISTTELLKELPALNDEGLTGAVSYFDAFTNDSRLVLDTLRSAEKAGAIVFNYAKLIDASPSGGAWQCWFQDQLSGQKASATARAVVNATGPWAQGLPHSRVCLRLTKGVHVLLHRRRLPVPDAVVLTEGKRILFVLPWGERVIAGTTDTDYSGPPEKVETQAEDVNYLLRALNQFFPKLELATKDILGTWAGVRPLIADSSGSASDISREHQIRSPEKGWWDVAGGKLTTYRLMAEQATDQIVNYLGTRSAACRTALEPLVDRQSVAGISGILPPAFSRQAVEHYCAKEWAITVEDVMIRRSHWHYYLADAGDKAEIVSRWLEEISSGKP